MGLKETIMGVAAGVFLEQPGRGKNLAEWKATLAASSVVINQRAAAANDPVQASKVLRHIAGIERWGQRRLQILLGAPSIRDEYDDYQPGTNLTLAEQREFFRQTRADTLVLVDQLQAAGVGDKVTAPHNDFGPLTACGWLRYLDMHANLESKKFR